MATGDQPSTPAGFAKQERDVVAANHREYDRGLDPLLELWVYGPVHGGWRFTNLAGAAVLDHLGRSTALGPDAAALEIGAGMGDGCRYLAHRFGCQVTGLELNQAQIEQARGRLAGDPALAGRVEYIEGDVLTWQPSRTYRAVFAVDSLMMIPDLHGCLAAARRALQAGGGLAFAEIMGGPALTDGARQYVWGEAGIINLTTPEDYAAALAEVGMTQIEVHDLRGTALANLEIIRRATEERQAQVLELGGTEALAQWRELAARYTQLFRDGQLAYAHITSVRAA
jgi:cyclopropane fatty-acyl-phospholipid synthase-like methyltransferase